MCTLQNIFESVVKNLFSVFADLYNIFPIRSNTFRPCRSTSMFINDVVKTFAH